MKLLGVMALGCGLISLGGCGKSGSAAPLTQSAIPAQEGTERWTGKLISSDGCKSPDDDTVVASESKHATTWTTPQSTSIPPPKGRQARFYACSRRIGKVFLFNNPAGHSSGVFFHADEATKRQVKYTLEGGYDSSTEEDDYFEEYAASLVNGKVRLIGGGSWDG